VQRRQAEEALVALKRSEKNARARVRKIGLAITKKEARTLLVGVHAMTSASAALGVTKEAFTERIEARGVTAAEVSAALTILGRFVDSGEVADMEEDEDE
jgi:hypothetical protein